MTQYVINIGAIPNDGTGDPLRTAFNETNLNFDQVFAAGPVLSNVRIANNTILTTNTNGNLVLSTNGTGVIQANVSVVPNLANLRNLGSALRRWNTVYTQYVDVSGPATFDQLTVTGNLTVNGNIIQIGNLVTDSKTIQLANTAATANAANGSGITVGANDDIATFLYTSVGNRWNTNIGVRVAGPANVTSLLVNQTANAWVISGNTITAPSGATWNSDYVNRDEYITSAQDGYINLTSLYASGNTASQVHLEHGLAQIVVDNGTENIWTFDDTGNLTLPGNTSSINYANGAPFGSTYGNANAVAYGESGWAGNIIPSGNAVYSLGNATNQWNDLYVSNATIFMNSVPISLSAGNVLTVNGNAVLTNGSNTAVSTTGNITAGNVLTGGIVSATGNISSNYFIGNGSQLTGISTANIGDITFVNTTISAPNDDDINIQALDSDGVLSSGIAMRPGDTYTRLEQWGPQDSQSFTTADWATGTYTTQGGGSIGAVEFTNTPNIINFVDSLQGAGHITFSVNGGPPVVWDGTSSGGNNITFLTPTLPDTDPTTVTSFEYFYSYNSRIEIDYDDEEFNITANNVDLTLSTTNQTDIALDSARDLDMQGNGLITLRNSSTVDSIQIQTDTGNTNRTWAFGTDGRLTFPGTPRIDTDANNFEVQAAETISLEANAVVNIYTDTSGTTYQWQFGNDGNLTLPRGGIVYETSIPGGALTGNTIALKPQGGADADQQLLIYPTAGPVTDDNHLHLTTGNLYNTELYLGNDNLYVKLANTGNVVVNSNDSVGNTAQWTFGTNESLTLPGGSRLRPLGANLDIIAGTGSYVNLITSDESSSIGVDNGGGYIVTAGGTWDFDTTGNLTAPGNVSAVGNITAGNISTGQGLVQSLDITADGIINAGVLNVNSSAVPGATGNISATGNVTGGNIITAGNVSGNTAGFAIGYRDIPQISFTGNATIATTDAGKHYYSTLSTGNVLTIANNASQGFQVGAAITIVNQGTGNITVAQGSGVTLYLAGNATAGNRTISTFGMATCIKVATDTWFINGTGVS